MDADDLRRRDELLEEALDIAPEQLAAFLRQRCPDSQEIRQEVERLYFANRKLQPEFLQTVAGSWAIPTLQVGQKIGRYEIAEVISSGGMSVVYRARDTGIGRLVAIKLLMPASATIPTAADTRFLAEVRILGSISHPNVVQIFDFGDIYGVPYIVMEYLEGEDLSRTLEGGRSGDTNWKLGVARQLSGALEHVHNAGIVHRDLKPANIFIMRSGAVKLMDFGIARIDSSRPTRASVLVGTPAYLAPEQVKGEAATHRSDIYSFGIVLFELFSGQKAYTGNTAELLYKIVHTDISIELLQNSGLPKPLISLIRSTTRKEPSRRPDSFAEVTRQLLLIPAADLTQNGTGTEHRRIRAVAASAIIAAGLGSAALLFVYRQSLKSPAPAANQTVSGGQVAERQEPQSAEPPAVRAETPVPSEAPARAPTQPEPVPTEAVRQRELSRNTRPLEPGRFESRKERILPSPSLTDPPAIATGVVQLPPVVPPLSATSVPPPPRNTTAPGPDQRAARSQAQQEIVQLLAAYSAAYGSRDLARVSAIWPEMSATERSRLEAAFLVAREMHLQLTPLGDPQLELTSDGTPRSATVRCRRVVRMTPRSGKAPPPTRDDCLFRLERRAGVWHIVSQD
jgi:serine/threonine protein kinase